MSIDAAHVPPAPAENEIVNAARESAETLALMARRRSTKFAHLGGPGPNAAQLETLLRLAARAPDHGKLGPWRFLVIEGEGRARAGEALADAIKDDAGVTPERLQMERARFLQAPLCVAVISNAQPHPKIPEWEQILSAAAVAYGLLIGAHAMGFAGCWLTEWIAYDARARAVLGLADHERIAGLVFIGTAQAEASERVRADHASRVSRF